MDPLRIVADGVCEVLPPTFPPNAVIFGDHPVKVSQVPRCTAACATTIYSEH